MLNTNILRALRRKIKIIGFDLIEDIIIFGSAARTNFKKYSDIDVLIVAKNFNEQYYHQNCDRVRNKIFNDNSIFHILAYGPHHPRVSKLHVFYCNSRELHGSHPIFRNINKQGISLKSISRSRIFDAH